MREERNRRERERETDRQTDRQTDRDRLSFAVALIYAFTGCFLYVPQPGIEPATLASDDALTN